MGTTPNAAVLARGYNSWAKMLVCQVYGAAGPFWQAPCVWPFVSNSQTDGKNQNGGRDAGTSLALATRHSAAMQWKAPDW